MMNTRLTMADFFAQLVRSPADETGSGETPPADAGTEGVDPLLGDPGESKTGEDGSSKSLIEGDGAGEGEGGEGEGAADPLPELEQDKVLEALKADGLEIDEASKEQLDDFFKLVAEERDPNKIAEQSLRMMKTVQDQMIQDISTVWNETAKAWQQEVRDHPEYGGANFEASLAKAKEVAVKYGGQEFLQLLSVSGAGNHVNMVAFLNKVAKDLPSEGTPVTGNPTAGAEKSLADKLFGGN
jgi:hypothetical protein